VDTPMFAQEKRRHLPFYLEKSHQREQFLIWAER
jgi:hypothetical protein